MCLVKLTHTLKLLNQSANTVNKAISTSLFTDICFFFCLNPATLLTMRIWSQSTEPDLEPTAYYPTQNMQLQQYKDDVAVITVSSSSAFQVPEWLQLSAMAVSLYSCCFLIR